MKKLSTLLIALVFGLTFVTGASAVEEPILTTADDGTEVVETTEPCEGECGEENEAVEEDCIESEEETDCGEEEEETETIWNQTTIVAFLSAMGALILVFNLLQLRGRK